MTSEGCSTPTRQTCCTTDTGVPNDDDAAGADVVSSGRAYLLMIFTMLFWAGNFVVGRALRDDLPAAGLSFWRWFVAGLILLPIAWPQLRREWKAIRRGWRVLLLQSILIVVAGNTLIYVAVEWTTAINAGLVVSAQPAIIVLCAWVLDRESINRVEAAGIAVALAGVIVIITRGDPRTLAGLEFNPGDLVMLVAVTSMALYAVLLRRTPRGISPTSLLAAVTIAGAAMLLPWYVADTAYGGMTTASAGVFSGILYAAVFPTCLAMLFWIRGIASVGPSRAAVMLYALPAFSSVLGWLFLDEALGFYQLVGFTLIAAGIYLVSQLGKARITPAA